MKYECMKIFGNIKIVAVLLLLFILNIIISMQNKTVMFEGYKSDVYKYYMDILEGEYTKEKYDYVMEEYERMKAHIANEGLYDEQYKKNLISSTEYRELSSAADLAKNRLKTFEYIVMKTEYYAQCEKTPSYFYDVDIEDYIVNMSANIPLLLSLILIIATLFNEDYVANTVHMIRSSKYGKERLYFRRIYLTVVLSVSFSVVFYVGEFAVKYFYMDLGIINSNACSLMGMSKAGLGSLNSLGSLDSLGSLNSLEGLNGFSSVGETCFNGTILEYIVISLVIRIVYTVLIALFISSIASFTHKYIATFAVSLGIVYLPSVITESMFTLRKGLEVYPVFAYNQNIHGVPDVMVAVVAYAVVVIVFMGIIGKKG